MIFGWAIFALLGVMVSHIGRHWKYWQMLHVGLELMAVLFSVLGHIIALAYTQVFLQNRRHEASSRGKCVALMGRCRS